MNKYVDVNEYQIVRIDDPVDPNYLEGKEDFVACDGTIYPFRPATVIGSGKYQVHVDDASDECEHYIVVDMYGVCSLIGMYGENWSDPWYDQWCKAMEGHRDAIDYIMRQGMVEEGFRTMTAYGYDFEGWDLVIDWDFNWVFCQHGGSAIRVE